MYFRYAKPYVPLALPITLISWWLVYTKGPGAFSGIFFLKMMTMLLGFVVLRKRHRFDIFFYQNVGYGEPRLLLTAGITDLLVWLFGVIVLIVTFS